MDDLPVLILLAVIGNIVGFINVTAGGGSSLSLPLLIFLGLDPNMANGTNRVALMIQNVSAITSFKQENYEDFGTSLKLGLCTVPGAVLGAIVGVRIDSALFQKFLAVAMIGVVLTLFIPKGKRALGQKPPYSWAIYPAMVGIGFYGGFLQLGVGFLLMIALRGLLALDLVRVNMHKVFIVLIYMVPTLFIYAYSGNVNWKYGLSLAVGNAFGAWWSAKLSVRRGEKFVRVCLAVAIVLMAVRLVWVS